MPQLVYKEHTIEDELIKPSMCCKWSVFDWLKYLTCSTTIFQTTHTFTWRLIDRRTRAYFWQGSSDTAYREKWTLRTRILRNQNCLGLFRTRRIPVRVITIGMVRTRNSSDTFSMEYGITRGSSIKREVTIFVVGYNIWLELSTP